jgi:hypothetical protein
MGELMRMNRIGRRTTWIMVGMIIAFTLHEIYQWLRPLFIDLCNAGYGGCG